MIDHAVLAVRILLTIGLLSAGALVMLLAATVTLFRARRFYSEGIATPLGRMALRLWGVRLVLHASHAFPESQTVYISNHTSTIDLFVLIALRLPNTRFFLSGYLRKLLPLGLIGYLIGVIWTVPQAHTERRRRIFREAAAELARSGESVFLSPEGHRITTGQIGAFNRGAFHLATALGAPIVPLFIAIPQSIDPGRGLAARAGAVDVYVHEPIATRDWREQDVDAHKQRVRELYVGWNARYRDIQAP